MAQSINILLELGIDHKASDIHLYPDKPPILRIEGQLFPLDIPPIPHQELQQLIMAMLNASQKEIFERTKELDFSYADLKHHHCRVNVHLGCGKIAATIRITPKEIPKLDELGLPPVIHKLCRKRQGLIILSGSAGTGKSTTLTYMVNKINEERKSKIIVIEDPIEYHHESKKSLVLQREVGTDTDNFATALKYALRQDPDVVVVGEMRDLESISMALTTAETGHLVLTTAHAPDAIETINRIIDVYPMGHRDQIWIQLARNLLGIISQNLVPCKHEQKRVLATEVLISSIAVQNLIRRGALVELRALLDSDKESGMHSLERCLSELLEQDIITEETAQEYANYQHTLRHYEERRGAQIRLQSKKTQHQSVPAKNLKDDTILIIDTNDRDRVDMALALRTQGYEEIILAHSHQEGVKKAEDHKPNIILLDFDPLDGNVFEVCKQIKSISGLKTDVILVTRWEMKPATSQAAKDAGVTCTALKMPGYTEVIQAVFNTYVKD
jgi:twitching motility protein PilT